MLIPELIQISKCKRQNDKAKVEQISKCKRQNDRAKIKNEFQRCVYRFALDIIEFVVRGFGLAQEGKMRYFCILSCNFDIVRGFVFRTLPL